jgi:hypothetical protein
MEGPLERTVRQVLKEKAPDLYWTLSTSGELDQFIYVSAVEANRQVQGLRRLENWDYLPHLELVQRLNEARAQAAEDILGTAREIYAGPAEVAHRATAQAAA